MSDFIETTGADIESAVAAALSELGVARDSVRIDVLEEPTRRLLGLGTRQARVRVTVIHRSTGIQLMVDEPEMPAKSVPEPIPSPQIEKLIAAPEPVAAAAPQPTMPPAEPITPEAPPPKREIPRTTKPAPKPHVEPSVNKPAARHDLDFGAEDDEHALPATSEELDKEAEVSAGILRELLKHMALTAEVVAHRAETDGRESPHWMLDVRGQELGALIGYKGETLTALQYVTRLIASNQLGRRANIVIDVEGYKSRKEMMLKRLAKRMADQAIERGRTVSLEPMPPHERRIIHLALRDNPAVTTESVGDGDKRKVTIVPRKVH